MNSTLSKLTNKDRFIAYLRAYESKSLLLIEAMLSENVSLRDWRIHVKGKTSVMIETKNNFNGANFIQIYPLHLYEAETSVAGELRIVIDHSDELFVVDIIDFTEDGKICSIRAFLGRADAT